MSHQPHRSRPSRVRYPAARAGLLAAVALLAGCGQASEPSDTPEGLLTPAAFVDVVVDLRESERALATEDSAAALFEERKAEVLARHEVTEDDLRAFLEAHGGDVVLLQEVWDSINQRLKYLPEPEPRTGSDDVRRLPKDARPSPDEDGPASRELRPAPGVRRLH